MWHGAAAGARLAAAARPPSRNPEAPTTKATGVGRGGKAPLPAARGPITAMLTTLSFSGPDSMRTAAQRWPCWRWYSSHWPHVVPVLWENCSRAALAFDQAVWLTSPSYLAFSAGNASFVHSFIAASNRTSCAHRVLPDLFWQWCGLGLGKGHCDEISVELLVSKCTAFCGPPSFLMRLLPRWGPSTSMSAGAELRTSMAALLAVMKLVQSVCLCSLLLHAIAICPVFRPALTLANHA